MNDFTKEELHIIHYWGLDRLENVGLPFFTEEGHLNLYMKIQSMIDNYCEHEKDNISYSSCPLGTDMIFQCKKCREFYR